MSLLGHHAQLSLDEVWDWLTVTYANPLWWLVFILSVITIAVLAVHVHYRRHPPNKELDD